jgi:hypothetical protein
MEVRASGCAAPSHMVCQAIALGFHVSAVPLAPQDDNEAPYVAAGRATGWA